MPSVQSAPVHQLITNSALFTNCSVCGCLPSRPGVKPALCNDCFALPQECQICRERKALSACDPCGHLACAACLQRTQLARTCFFCRTPVFEARDAHGTSTLPYRRDAAQLGREASAALGYEQSVQLALDTFSDDDSAWSEDWPETSLPLALVALVEAWLRGEVTQQLVEREARENVRITETAPSVAHAKRELEALTRRLHECVAERPRDPTVTLRGIARRYDRITTGLLAPTERFLSRWSRFHRTCWAPFQELRAAWADPTLGEALGRMAVRLGRADSIPPLLSEALEESLACARQDVVQLLDVHRRLCIATHQLLSTAHVLHSESLADPLLESSPRLRCFGRFYRSFKNACSPLTEASAASCDVPLLLGMLSAGVPTTLRDTWACLQRERDSVLRLLGVSRRVEERTVRAHLRDWVREPALSTVSRGRKRRRSSSSSSSLSHPTDTA